MATYNFTFVIPSTDLTNIPLNNSVTNTYQVATTYANGNVVSSSTSNKVVATITMTDIDQNDIRLSTFGMTCSFQDNNVALDSTFTKIGTSTTSATISSQVGGSASLVGTAITFNYQLVGANSNPYLQVTGTITTSSPLYGKLWGKNVNPGTLPGKINSISSGNSTTINYKVNNVNPNPTKGARNNIYPVETTASKPFLLINPNNQISPTSVSVNSIETVGTTTIMPGSAMPITGTAIFNTCITLNQKITNKSNGNVIYYLPPSINSNITGTSNNNNNN
jgi:hypothetical protein